MRNPLRLPLPVLLVPAAMVLAFWKQLFHRDFTWLSGQDMVAQAYPWFSAAAHWFQRGEFLLWDPYVYSGKANLGELQPGIFYPLNWLAYILPGPTFGVSFDVMEGLVLLHFMLGAGFMYLLARSFGLSPTSSLLAGLVFALGGYTRQVVAFLNIFSGFVWMPLIFFLYRRALDEPQRHRQAGYLLAAAAAMSLSFLAGHHVGPIHTGLLLAFYTAYRLGRDFSLGQVVAKGVMLASIPVGVALLTALQWLPSLEWARGALRWVDGSAPVAWGEGIPYPVLATTGNLQPQDFLSLVAPYLSSGANLYSGPVILFLAATGFLFASSAFCRFLGLLCFVYYGGALGLFSAIHGWINTFIPGVWFAREAFHYLVPLQLCLALLAGFGLDTLVAAFRDPARQGYRRFVRRTVFAFAAIGIGAGLILLAARVVSNLPYHHAYVRSTGLLLLFSLALAGLLFLLYTGRLSPERTALLLSLLAFVDVSSRIAEDARRSDRPRGDANPAARAVWKRPPLVDELRALRAEGRYRIDDPDQVLPVNFGDVWRLEGTMGHGATMRADYHRFRSTDWSPSGNVSALLNVRHFLSKAPVEWTDRVAGEDGAAAFRNPRAVPRAWFPRRYRIFADGDDTGLLGWIRSPLFAPGTTVLLTPDEFARIPTEVARSLVEETGPEIRLVHRLQQGDRLAGQAEDPKERRRLSLFKAPWGWSPGDELEFEVEDSEGREVELWIRYFPAEAVSRPTVRLHGAGGTKDVVIELPAVEPEDSGGAVETVVSLGALSPGPHRVQVRKTDDCPARLDAVGLRWAGPGPGSGPGMGSGSGSSVDAVEFVDYEPNRMVLEVVTSAPRLLLLSELYDPGWRATVQGEPVTVIRADYILRGIPVPAGQSEVVLTYRPSSLVRGLAISAAAAILLPAVLLTWSRLNRRRNPTVP